MKSLVFLLFVALPFATCGGAGKYAKEVNDSPEQVLDIEDPDTINFRTLQKPFRMAKLNLVWAKAQHRLTEPKLRSLFTELKIHDKEELAWKHLNAQHQDKDGLKAAELRKKLVGIMSTYDLLEYFDEAHDPEKYKHYRGKSGPVEEDKYKNKSLFKDKKLNKLWEKAEVSGFTPEELAMLKQEFEHHQEKIDMYYKLIENLDEQKPSADAQNVIDAEEQDAFNEILSDGAENEVDKPTDTKHTDHLHKVNLLREKHCDLKDNLDRLERMAARGPNNQDFVEPKVRGLWRVAVAEGKFSAEELASLKVELMHYESRLLKLRHLHAEAAIGAEKYKQADHGDKIDQLKTMEETIKKQTRKVEKLGAEIEKRVFKHSEL